MKLYAIFKNGFHKGNERANNGNDAIKNYIITSELLDFLKTKKTLYILLYIYYQIHYRIRNRTWL